MKDAFVLRISPSGIDRVPEALETNELIIGWSEAAGLLDSGLEWQQFRQIVHEVYHSDKESYARAGGDAGHLWRFIREMKEGDRVLVPHGAKFYTAEVVGPAYYNDEKVYADTAYRRAVKWLNGGESIPRRYARSALQRRMKTRGTCARATDLNEEIDEAIQAVKKEDIPSFEKDLRLELLDKALEQMRSGRIDDYGFERLVATVLKSIGATEVSIRSRSKMDKGADVIANFFLAATFEFTLAVQVKHYKPEPPVGPEVLNQLVGGMEAEGTDLGWVVTSGTFSEEAFDSKAAVEEERGFRIELVDGEQLAAMIVEGGLREIYS